MACFLAILVLIGLLAVPLAVALSPLLRRVRFGPAAPRRRVNAVRPSVRERTPVRRAVGGSRGLVKVKHLMDAVEADDGQRLWVEPVGLTRDLRGWCEVEGLLTHLAPPPKLSEWFQWHGGVGAYELFCGAYREHLSAAPHRQALQELAGRAREGGVTLLHQGDDPDHNTATALCEFLSEIGSFCPPEA